MNHNFDPITMEDKPENVLVNIYCSVKNLRRHLVYDQNSRKQTDIANRIKRTSFLAELECKLCIALNSKSFQTFEGSPIFNLILDYIELFYDKADIITDLLPYLKLFNHDDAMNMREKIKGKIEALEGGFSLQHSQAHS